MSYIIATRPSPAEREQIRAAARKRGVPISRFMIDAACKAAAAMNMARTFASLEIDPTFRMAAEASRAPKRFIRQRIRRKHAIHR